MAPGAQVGQQRAEAAGRQPRFGHAGAARHAGAGHRGECLPHQRSAEVGGGCLRLAFSAAAAAAEPAAPGRAQRVQLQHRFGTAVAACRVAKLWEDAVDLVLQMRHEALAPNLIVFSGAIGACGASGAWEVALGLLKEMESQEVWGDQICYSTVLSACERASAWAQGLASWRQN
ncbi:unnamed protein product, partial [Effrenium voratum]